MDKDLLGFFKQAQKVSLRAAEKEALRPHVAMEEQAHSVRAEGKDCQNEHMALSFERFLTASQTLRLTDAERSESFERILGFMEAHPIQAAFEENGASDGLSPLRALISLLSSLRLMPVLAFALLLLIGGGVTSAAAEGALPGSTLYPIKIHVNEAVREAFAGSAQAKARLQTQLVERRLGEASALAAQGTLKPELQQQVATAIAARVTQARKDIAALSVEGDLENAADVSTQLETSVQAHHNVFTRLAQSQGSSVDVILGAFAQADADSAQAQLSLRERLAAASSDAAASVARKGIEAAQRQADSMKTYLEGRGSEFSVQAKAEMQARLKTAQDAIAQAQARFAAGASAQAASMAAQANAAAQEGRALGAVQQLLNVQVNTVGSDADTHVDVQVNGDAQPQVKVSGNGKATVKINGKEVTAPAAGVSSASSLSSSSSPRSSSTMTQQQTSVSVNVQQSASQGSTTTNSETHVNTNTNVNVQGGGSVHIEQNAGATVNSTVHIGN
jgi:hypothetical protein